MLINFEEYPIVSVLDLLLKDKTTKQNIIFATDAYSEFGEKFSEKSEITVNKLIGSVRVHIVPRVEKASDEQLMRTRKKAEVFTPSWIVNRMNNHCDEEWFGKRELFNTETDKSWVTNLEPIPFSNPKEWQKYVDSRRLEITCGEAPYLVSRYDTTTGKIIPIEDRIGILDRKLRIINENATNDGEWLKWVERAFQSTYGYEFQGDNLIIARINLLKTFIDYYSHRFGEDPSLTLIKKYSNIICWNIWQMDGLTGLTPFAVSFEQTNDGTQLSMFDDNIDVFNSMNMSVQECKIWDWRRGNALLFRQIKGGH